MMTTQPAAGSSLPPQTPENQRERARRLADKLAQLSADVRARNADASDEVKAAAGVLADEIARIATAVRTLPSSLLRGELAVQRHLALLEAKDRFAVIERIARTALAGAARSSTFFAETARMKLALAKLDASDVIEETRRRMKKKGHELEARGEAALSDLDDRVTDLIGWAMWH